MLRSFSRHRLLHLLACLAVALMLVAPLISRWSQTRSIEPMCMGAPALPAESVLYDGHRTQPINTSVHHQYPGAALAPAHAGTHDTATHGEACDYCVLAARLIPLFSVALLCLLRLRPTLAAKHRQASVRPVLRWTALGARAPPLPASGCPCAGVHAGVLCARLTFSA